MEVDARVKVAGGFVARIGGADASDKGDFNP